MSQNADGINFGGKPRFFNNTKKGGTTQVAPPLQKSAEPFYPKAGEAQAPAQPSTRKYNL